MLATHRVLVSVQVRMSCVHGCTCGDEIIDAAVTVRESLHKIHVARVTQSAECHVRFEVLPETSSNGHRFKITSLSVRVEDMVDS